MGCEPSKNHKEFYNIGKKFMNDPAVKALFKNPSILVAEKFRQLFGFSANEWKAWEPKKSDIRKFKGEMKYVLKHIKKSKVAGVLGSNMYTTSGVVRRNPVLGKLYDSFLSISHEMKGRQVTGDNSFNKVIRFLRDESVLTGMRVTDRSFKKAFKRMQKLETKIEKFLVEQEQGVSGSEKKLGDAMGELDGLLAKGEGKVYKDFITLIESKDKGLRSISSLKDIIKDRKGKHLTATNIKDIKNAIEVSNITTSANMKNALTQYVEMTHTMHNTLTRGAEAYIEAVKEGMRIKGVDEARISQIGTKLQEKLSPEEKVGYYPHFRYDLNSLFLDGLMPKLQKVSDATAFNAKKGITAALDELDLYISKRVKPRTKNLDDKNYSLNFPVTIKRYMDEINRFNYVSYTQMHTRQALREAKNAFQEGKDLEGYGAQMIDMIKDLNQAQLGTREIQNPEIKNFSRLLLNLEFTSKLGFNIRSALRNATQGLLNFVEFGPRMMYKSKDFYRDEAMLNKVDKAMEESGIRFTEAEGTAEQVEIGGKNIFSERVKFADGGEIEFTNPSKLSQLADMSGKLAGKSGSRTLIPYVNMRSVENFNRKHTYRFGFYKMYNSLHTSNGFREMLKDKWQESYGRDFTAKEFENELFKRSKNYAERMVTLLHFDYSTVSKSKIMRSPIGRFMFQFQHYAYKFGEYNFKIGRDARHGLMAGEWNFSGDVGKAYRMGLSYFLVPALVTAITKSDISRLVQHDSYDRIAQWWTFFTGDEEEFKKATYGRGAIGALVGAPVLSDALAIGEVFELWNLEDHEYLQMALGYTDMSNTSDDVKLKKLANILNIQTGRLVYQTSGLLMDGHLGTAVTFEAGLYPTSKAKDYRETLVDKTPKKVLEALEYIQQHISAARGKKKYKEPPATKKKKKAGYVMF